ncbi:formate--tetrahydrofolate ligase [Boudabousia marimammalium]|uniref:Formate--tetrahydrofolate ligase n=1 Tax=Boudabousia marimammalium TaxID=156892 RepID=A0A1Q5PL57_9ACTO|nr:formate--tetrahydrofolate ligase [Boudabousia marimammalium]OKL47378.1 formate--tetrahydrofolate ligase [Boudabousia marimammalium]
MAHLSDIEIAQQAELAPVTQIAEDLGIDSTLVDSYGRYKAKIDLAAIDETKIESNKLVLVTAMSPTPAGEGKTTTTVGLADALRQLGKNVSMALREPSLGPVFGLKGGACGGGYAQVVPMEDINLHFTGDFHAISAANNLLAAMLDNHIYQGNELGINPKRVVIKRCVDMNDRQLRHVVDGLGSPVDGVSREDGFEITVASEVMAIFCLATSIPDLKEKLGNMIVAYTYDQQPVTARDLGAVGAMTALLKEAIKPNLVQSLEHTPAIVHGGPFANIAHGCNSILATKLSRSLSEYTVTEAGFGADLGAEKFLDIMCRITGTRPNCSVVVGTVRALKMHGGVAKTDLDQENVDAVKAGLPNLLKHVENMVEVYQLPTVVALNLFPTDTEAEIALVIEECARRGVQCVRSEVWARGGAGGVDLAREVIRLCESPAEVSFAYQDDDSVEEKINQLVQRVYGGSAVEIAPKAQRVIAMIEKMGLSHLPICMAKTQYSFSDDPRLLGSPRDFTLHVKNVKVNAGAGFIVVYTGDILTMPGLPRVPAAARIDVDERGTISGLF